MKKISRERGIDRAIDILDCLRDEGRPMVINELAALMGAPRSTIYQMCKVLLDRSILDFYSDGRIFLGRKLFIYGSSVSQHYSLIEIAKPFINKLAKKLGETVELNGLVDWKQGILYAVEGKRHYFYTLKKGDRYPSYPLPLTSSGRFLIDGLDKTTLIEKIPDKDYFQGDKRIISLESFMQECLEAKKCGFSIVSDLLEIHLSSISCPIFDSNGSIIATIGLAFPTGEIEKNKSYFIDELKQASSKIQEKFLE